MSTTKPLFRHWGRNWLWQMALLTAWSFGVSTAQVGARLHNNSLANNAKSNQSRIWFHDGKWWTIATYKPSNTDYIWRYNAAGDSWIRTVTPLDSGKVNRYDVSLDAQTGELAVLRSHTTDTKFYRFTYSAGVWTVALAKSLSNFGNTDNGNPCTLVKAENGDYWIFRIKGNTLQTRQSSNSGATWSGSINVKTGLHTARGSTAAVRFAQGASASYVGVAYGELGTAGVNTEYGFLHHLDGAPVDAWTDESQMLAPQGKERGNNQLSLVADPQNQLYLFTRSFGGGQPQARSQGGMGSGRRF